MVIYDYLFIYLFIYYLGTHGAGLTNIIFYNGGNYPASSSGSFKSKISSERERYYDSSPYRGVGALQKKRPTLLELTFSHYRLRDYAYLANSLQMRYFSIVLDSGSGPAMNNSFDLPISIHMPVFNSLFKRIFADIHMR
jgi:hypothetical protein